MSDMIEDGLLWLSGELQDNCSKQVTVRRGDRSIVFNATFESQAMRSSDGQGNTKIERADADFTFPASVYDFGDGVVEPDRGDLFEVVFGAVTKRFQALPMNDGREPSWRYCDAHQIDVRVHTKFLATV